MHVVFQLDEPTSGVIGSITNMRVFRDNTGI